MKRHRLHHDHYLFGEAGDAVVVVLLDEILTAAM
jgi:hypothetical protein